MEDAVIEDLSRGWREAGVQEGDLLLLHANLLPTLHRLSRTGVKGDARLVLESFLHALGPTGTLMLPLFNFDFAKGVPFDMRNTRSHMGALSEAGRLHPRAVRTGHPFYSFAVIGAKAPWFAGVRNFHGYGGDSPFASLRRLGGKIGVLELSEADSMTFYHHAEETMEADYRYHKRFTGQYIDLEGRETTETFGLFVRDLDRRVMTRVNPMGALLWEKGLYAGFQPRERCGLRVIRAQDMFDEACAVIAQGQARGLLYEIE
jgi:aminoglycoside 3-N-acetyltransferase